MEEPAGAERINDGLERRLPGRKAAAFFVHDTHVTPSERMDGLTWRRATAGP